VLSTTTQWTAKGTRSVTHCPCAACNPPSLPLCLLLITNCELEMMPPLQSGSSHSRIGSAEQLYTCCVADSGAACTRTRMHLHLRELRLSRNTANHWVLSIQGGCCMPSGRHAL
jgi:hypothetical protein